jgi:conjugal transfer pilus assembly protein TraD
MSGRSERIIDLTHLIGRMHWSEPIADGLVSVLANNKSKYQALINSLFPLLEKLTTGKIAELLSPDWGNPNSHRRSFDWDKIMNTGGIVYFGLDSLSDFEVAAAVGNAAFSDLTSTAGRRYKFGTAYGQSQGLEVEQSTKVAIHADEFNELVGDEFVPMLNKAGGAGYQVTVYTQTWSDVEAKIGSRAKAQQIAGNLNTLLMLRVKNTETAEILTDQLPKVEILTSNMDSRTSDAHNPDDFSDFSSATGDKLTQREVPMIQPADLVQLPKGQCFALLEGGQLAKLRLPLPMGDAADIHWPAHLQVVFSGMHSQYQRYVDSVEGLPGDFEGRARHGLTVEGAGGGY